MNRAADGDASELGAAATRSARRRRRTRGGRELTHEATVMESAASPESAKQAS
jgi:hypothetical protein